MRKHRMYLRVAGTSLAMLSGIAVAGPAQAAKGGSTCPGDLRTEAGTCAAPIDAAPLTAADKQERADKEAAVAAFREHEKQRTAAHKANGGTVTPYVVPPEDQSGSDYRIPEVVNMTIWKEGQGNGKKHYTCGPSATRNAVAAMNMDRYGEYRDLGEQQWETWEGTTTDGT